MPAALELTADVHAQVGNNAFEQDVTRFHARYGYRRSRRLEPFVWMERQSNSFMSITSRYEAGGGVRIGTDLWPAPGGEPRALAHLVQEGPAGFGCALRRLEATFHPPTGAAPDPCMPAPPGASPAAAPGPTRAAFERVRAALPAVARSLQADASRAYLGLGLGVFSELENAALATGVSTASPPEAPRPLRERIVQLPGRHRYRLLVAPKVEVRPLRDVRLSLVPNFKLPISSPRIGHNGVMAYRLDLFVRLDWAFGRSDAGRDVRLVLKFDYYKNMGPPSLTDDIIAAAALEGVAYDRTLATKKHRVVSLGVVIGLPS